MIFRTMKNLSLSPIRNLKRMHACEVLDPPNRKGDTSPAGQDLDCHEKVTKVLEDSGVDLTQNPSRIALEGYLVPLSNMFICEKPIIDVFEKSVSHIECRTSLSIQ